MLNPVVFIALAVVLSFSISVFLRLFGIRREYDSGLGKLFDQVPVLTVIFFNTFVSGFAVLGVFMILIPAKEGVLASTALAFAMFSLVYILSIVCFDKWQKEDRKVSGGK